DVVTGADAGTKTTADVEAATKDVQTAIVAAKAAKDNATTAAQKDATPVGNEKPVSDAKTALDNALADPTSDAKTLKTVADDYTKAISDAKTARATAKTDGQAAVDTATTDGVDQNPDVVAAVKAYTDVVTGADAGTKTTADVEAATKDVQTAIAAAKAAKDNATTATQQDATPVGNEKPVSDAKTALDNALADPKSDAATLKAVADDYTKAISDAKTARATATTAGQKAVDTATTDGVDQEPAVAKAITAYNDVAKGAGAGTKTTADVTAATTAVQAAIDAAKAAKDKATEATHQDATPVGNEDTVVAAKQQLADVLTTSTSDTATLTTATKDYINAIEAAKTARDHAKTAGQALVSTVNAAGLQHNPAVATAITNYQMIVAATDVEKATTAEVQAAVGVIQTALTAAQNAYSQAQTAGVKDATPVSNESGVQATKAALVTALSKQTSSNQTLTTAAKAYVQAIATAKQARDDAKTAGQAIVASATTAGVADNVDVAVAIQAYAGVVQAADAEQATTAEVQAAAAKLQATITAAKTAKANAEAALNQDATPVANEPSVTTAKQALTTTLADPSSSTKDLNAATQAYGQAIAAAQKARTAALNAGSKLIDQAHATTGQKTPAVTAAINDYEKLVTVAKAGHATTAMIQAAATKIQAAMQTSSTTPAPVQSATSTQVPVAPGQNAPTQQAYPQTGEKQSNAGVIGLAVTALVAMLGLGEKKRKQD
ncbi:hypothetical protein, partial [Lacticaseibacillus sp. GG6-2]